MDRNREARRASIVGSNGFNRRRHRTNSLRDSPDEDGGVELQESVRLRERVKKDRDRERERERERDLRERSSRHKRRRAERLTSNRDDLGDETSEESVNDDEDDEYEETATAVKLLTPPVGSISNHHHHGHVSSNQHSHTSSLGQQQQHNTTNNNMINSNHHQLQHRKSFPPAPSSSKVFRPPPVWKSGDEMIGVSVPRKARSASMKRSHDWISSSSNNNSGGGVSGGENQILRQPSSSPVRQGLVSTSTALPAAPMSPSSSNISSRKKLKPGVNNSGPKMKPPKVSSKPTSSNPEELEIEIAEVLYGLMTQSQGPSSSKKEESREINRSSNEAKLHNSSSSTHPILGSNSSPLSAVAPKRKRPRQIPENSSYGARSSPMVKPDMDQTPKSEVSSEKVPGSTVEIGFQMEDSLVNSQPRVVQPADTQIALESTTRMDSGVKPLTQELRESLTVKEEASSPKEKDTPVVRLEENSNRASISTVNASISASNSMIKASLTVSEMQNRTEEKFEIDLMAPPPQVRSSPERETTDAEVRASAIVDQKPVLSITDAESKADKEGDKGKKERDHPANEEKKAKLTAEKAIENKERNIDLRLDLERDGSGGVNANGNKLQMQTQKPVKATREEPLTEKSGQSTNSLPLPMSMANWPGSLPPMGYMAPMPGVVSMDGTTVTPPPIQPVFTQPRPKRCATHCHIARNIHYLQQFMKMNPFWPAGPGSASLFGSRPANLNVMPADLHGNVAVRGPNTNNSPHDEGHSFANNIPNHVSKDKISQSTTTLDSSQRKQQILIQQAIPPVPPNNLLGPAFIFPLNQQQAAAVRPSGGGKSQTNVAASTTGAASSSGGASATSAAGVATAMSFNFPNMGANETPYLAILQNNGYPFPIPTVGAPPNYRPAPGQAMPMFNGSFYSSQMIHPSQIQQPNQPLLQQAHPNNTSGSNNSSSSQKRPQSSSGGPGPGSSNLQGFSTQKAQPSQQQSHSQNVYSSRSRHLENEPGGGEDGGPSTASRASLNIYGPNFAMPIHPQNFALMTQQAGGGNGNQTEKKPLKAGMDSMPPHSFAMSFGPINGTGPSIDMASMAQNHAMFQNSPEATRQMMAAAAAAAQVAHKKNLRISEDNNNKSGGGDSSSAMDDERKGFSAKSNVGQSFAFTRSDLSDSPSNVIESSTRSLNPSSGPARSSRPMSANPAGSMNAQNVQNAQIQAQFQHQQMMQQIKQQQHQQQMAANRSKVPSTSNGTNYSDHMAAKFPNSLSGYPQNIVASSNSSPSHSPQWKSSTATKAPNTSQTPSTAAGLKNIPQQHSSRPTQSQSQMHNTQISFGGGNQKPSTTHSSQGQQQPSNGSNNNQAPSPPMMVSSPTTSSMSKGGSGNSPRTTNANAGSNNNKSGLALSFSAQQQNKSSAPSILGNPHITSSSSGPKPIQQHLLSKAMQQHPFLNPYASSQSQSPHSTSSTNSGPGGGYYMQRRPDQHQQSPGGAQAISSSTGVLSLSTSTNIPAKAANCNVKGGGGGGLPPQGVIHASQYDAQSGGTLLPAGFSYVRPVPAAVQVKPTAEQKQTAGNDNSQAWQPEKK